VEGCSLAQPHTQLWRIGCPEVARPSRVARGAAGLLAGIILALGAPAGADPVAPKVAPTQQAPAEASQAVTTPAAAETGTLDPGAPPAAKPQPPLSVKAREAAHIARLDDVVAPLLKYELPVDDGPKVKGAIEALAAGNFDKAADFEKGVTDPIARKLIAWYRLRQGEGQARDYLAFITANPEWPSQDYLRQRMEEALFVEGGNADLIATYFKDGKAQSGAGLALLGSVELAHGDKAKAKALASEAWRKYDLPPSLEPGFLARFGSLLTEEDHKWRLDRLLVDDVRYQANRKERAEIARRVIPLLSAPEQKTAQARLAVFLQSAGAKSKVKAAAPKAKGSDWGLVFHKVQALRQASKLDEGAKLILTVPTDPAVVANLDEWWIERQKLAYLALNAKKPKLAYDLVRDAGPISNNGLNEQSFMAGWIALRYLKDKDAAERHFTAFIKSADGPLSRAKSHYWLGRLYEAKGDRAKVTEEYRAAAASIDTFYGLLAMQKLDPGSRRISLSPPVEPTLQQAERLNALDIAKAIFIARKAGLNTSIPRIIFQRLYTLDDSEGWAGMVAHLARSTGDTQTAVRIGKQAIARGQNLVMYSYPVHALPEYKPLRPPPEIAVLFGLARQETEFNIDTVSGAGARGILQVMKDTANHVCRDYKIKCDHKRLLTDGSYNTMIASAYVADRLAEFEGSYVLSIASYNAGPGRAHQWIGEFGDPRKANVDPIDWIERIPIEETRRYVAKVLSNIQIYRARLGDEATALRLDQDLARAREASLAPKERKAANADTAKSE
jgi:peptidoglycan lytic transglycosylase